jgi:hypothetical protein
MQQEKVESMKLMNERNRCEFFDVINEAKIRFPDEGLNIIERCTIFRELLRNEFIACPTATTAIRFNLLLLITSFYDN